MTRNRSGQSFPIYKFIFWLRSVCILSQLDRQFTANIDREPIGQRLFQKIGFTKVAVAILFLVLSLFELIFLRLPLHPIDQHTLPDLMAHVIWAFVILPGLWIYYTWSRTRQMHFWDNLALLKTVNSEQMDSYQSFIKKAKHRTGSIVFSGLAFGAALILIGYLWAAVWQQDPPIWFFSVPYKAYGLLLNVANAYIGILVIIREFHQSVASVGMFRRFKIAVDLFHYDGAGGLGVVGNYYLSLALAVAAALSLLSIYNFIVFVNIGSNVTILSIGSTSIGMLFAMLFIFGFLPILLGHREMAQQKANTLKALSFPLREEYTTAYAKLIQQRQNTESLTTVKAMYEFRQLVENSFPVWPFSNTLLKQIVGLLLVTLITKTAELTGTLLLSQVFGQNSV